MSTTNKPKYDPKIHHRRSIRLKEYDYSQAGAYFITICVKDKSCLFGNILDDKMILNDAGAMVDKWWQKIPEKFPDIELDEYQIMPNHFHAIVVNTGNLASTGTVNNLPGEENTLGEHTGSPLFSVVRWFKTMSTNEYIRNVKSNNWPTFNGKLFQRNYWEHIIRGEQSYNNIADYIRNNPAKWANDMFHTK
jgi:putative transposase